MLNALQCHIEEGSFQREQDFPPGFGPRDENADCDISLDLMKDAALCKEIKRKIKTSDKCLEVVKNVQESVEFALYQSARTSLFEYFEDIIKVELTNMFLAALDHKSSKVSFMLKYLEEIVFILFL